MRHPSGNHGEKGVLTRVMCALNFRQSFLEACIRIESGEGSGPFRSHPITPVIGLAGRYSRPSLFDESSKVATPLCDMSSGHSIGWTLTEVFRYGDQRVQDIMQFICIAHVRPGFFANLGNRRPIEPANLL